MSIDLDHWNPYLPNAVDCSYCIAGYVPASDRLCGEGFVRCANHSARDTVACPECGITAFYPLQLRTDQGAWLDRINRRLRLIPEICPTCVGVIGLRPIPEEWGATS